LVTAYESWGRIRAALDPLKAKRSFGAIVVPVATSRDVFQADGDDGRHLGRGVALRGLGQANERVEATAMRRVGRVVRAVLVVAGTTASVACGNWSPPFTATDGTHFEFGPTTPDPRLSSLKASGAHDLPCAVESIKVTDLNGGDYVAQSGIQGSWAVTGCGWRVVYTTGDYFSNSSHLNLLSRSPLTPEPAGK
jgi:hypothetical protein